MSAVAQLLMQHDQRAQFVVALHDERVVRTLQLQALVAGEFAQPDRVERVDHQLRAVAPHRKGIEGDQIDVLGGQRAQESASLARPVLDRRVVVVHGIDVGCHGGTFLHSRKVARAASVRARAGREGRRANRNKGFRPVEYTTSATKGNGRLHPARCNRPLRFGPWPGQRSGAPRIRPATGAVSVPAFRTASAATVARSRFRSANSGFGQPR